MFRFSVLPLLMFLMAGVFPANALQSTFVKVDTPAAAPIVQQRVVTSTQQTCPRCGKIHGTAVAPQRAVSVDQAHAQREANLQAQRGRMGHWLGCSPNARFSGVGMSSNPNNVPTCTPRGRMTLIADATARGRNGMYYRSRHWR